VNDVPGRADREAVQPVIVPAVLEFLPDAGADLDLQARRYRHVAAVEKRMEVPPHEKAVLDPTVVRSFHSENSSAKPEKTFTRVFVSTLPNRLTNLALSTVLI